MRKPPSRCQKSITVNLDKELDSFVRAYAKKKKESMNQIINDAVRAYRKGKER